MRNRDERSLFNVLKGIFEENPKLERGFQEMCIREAWKELFGDVIDKYTDKITFSNGVVYITLNSSTMRQEVAYRKQEIIDRLHQHMGKTIITDLIIK